MHRGNATTRACVMVNDSFKGSPAGPPAPEDDVDAAGTQSRLEFASVIDSPEPRVAVRCGKRLVRRRRSCSNRRASRLRIVMERGCDAFVGSSLGSLNSFSLPFSSLMLTDKGSNRLNAAVVGLSTSVAENVVPPAVIVIALSMPPRLSSDRPRSRARMARRPPGPESGTLRVVSRLPPLLLASFTQLLVSVTPVSSASALLSTSGRRRARANAKVVRSSVLSE